MGDYCIFGARAELQLHRSSRPAGIRRPNASDMGRDCFRHGGCWPKMVPRQDSITIAGAETGATKFRTNKGECKVIIGSIQGKAAVRHVEPKGFKPC